VTNHHERSRTPTHVAKFLAISVINSRLSDRQSSYGRRRFSRHNRCTLSEICRPKFGLIDSRQLHNVDIVVGNLRNNHRPSKRRSCRRTAHAQRRNGVWGAVTDIRPSRISAPRKSPLGYVPCPVASLPAFGSWAPPAERDPSLDSIYRVSLTVDLCEGNKIISFKKLFHHSQLGAPQKEKNPGALGTCLMCPLIN